jgi:hypothetical protein
MIDERFAYIEHGEHKFQVLKNDENGNPIDWDEAATAAKYQEWLAAQSE